MPSFARRRCRRPHKSRLPQSRSCNELAKRAKYSSSFAPRASDLAVEVAKIAAHRTRRIADAAATCKRKTAAPAKSPHVSKDMTRNKVRVDRRWPTSNVARLQIYKIVKRALAKAIKSRASSSCAAVADCKC